MVFWITLWEISLIEIILKWLFKWKYDNWQCRYRKNIEEAVTSVQVIITLNNNIKIPSICI